VLACLRPDPARRPSAGKLFELLKPPGSR
jgi:hypothetical protein